jgi:hypothetical protein
MTGIGPTVRNLARSLQVQTGHVKPRPVTVDGYRIVMPPTDRLQQGD